MEKVAPFLLGARRNEGVVQIAASEQDVQLQGFRPTLGPDSLQLVVAVNNSVVNRRSSS